MDKLYDDEVLGRYIKNIENRGHGWSEGGNMSRPKLWDALSMGEKADMMKVAVRNGITDLKTIREKYNEFAEGGNILDGGGGLTPRQEAMRYFMNKGLTDYQAAGLVGNLIRESQLIPTATNAGSGAYGIAQWLGPRKKALVSRYGKSPSLQQQLDFVWDELNSTHKTGLSKLRASSDVAEAARNAMGYYEFSAGPDAAVREMKKWGQDGEGSMRKGIEFASALLGQPVPEYTPVSQPIAQQPEMKFTPLHPEVFGLPVARREEPVVYEITEPVAETVKEPTEAELRRQRREDNMRRFNLMMSLLSNSESDSPFSGIMGMMPGDTVQPFGMFAEGGSIHIAPSKKGTFTAAASKHGMGVQEFASKVLAHKEDYSPAMVKKANFARNARKWKHGLGGNLYPIGGYIDYAASNSLNSVGAQHYNPEYMKTVENVLSYAPVIGTMMDWGEFAKDPSWGNLGWAALSTAGDLFGASLLKGTRAATKEFKAAKQAEKAAEEALDAHRKSTRGIIARSISEEDARLRKQLENARWNSAVKSPLLDKVLEYPVYGAWIAEDAGINSLQQNSKAYGGNLFDGFSEPTQQMNTGNVLAYYPDKDYYTGPQTRLPEVTITGEAPSWFGKKGLYPTRYRYNPKKTVASRTGQLTAGDVMKGIDVATGPLLHWTQPSQYVGAIRDAVNGRNPLTSMLRGNSGVVSEKYAQEHPWLSTAFNLGTDIVALGGLSKIPMDKAVSAVERGAEKASTLFNSPLTGRWTQIGSREYRLNPNSLGASGVPLESRTVTPRITAENAVSMTPEQWTAAQDAAIARGDMAEAQRLSDLHGEIRGYNIKGSHASKVSDDFTEFNTGLKIKGTNKAPTIYNDSREVTAGAFFGDNSKGVINQFGKPRDFLLKIDSPLQVDAYGMRYNKLLPPGTTKEDIIKEVNNLRAKGYTEEQIDAWIEGQFTSNADEYALKVYNDNVHDGAIIENVYEGHMNPVYMEDAIPTTDYIITKPSQAKLADAVTYDPITGKRIPLGDRHDSSKNSVLWGLLPFGVGLTGYGLYNRNE